MRLAKRKRYFLVLAKFTPLASEAVKETVVISEEPKDFLQRNEQRLIGNCNRFEMLFIEPISRKHYFKMRGLNPDRSSLILLNNDDCGSVTLNAVDIEIESL